MSGRYETLIQQSDDPYGPPGDPVLRVTVCGRDVFLEVCEYEEDAVKTTITKVAGVMVPILDLCRSLFSGSPVNELMAEKSVHRSSAGEDT